jgi:hypothetical protein
MAFSDDRETHTATIDAAGSLSAAVPLGGKALVGIMMAATASGDFDATTTNVQFQVSMDGTTYELLRINAGTPVAVIVAENNTNGASYLSPDQFTPWRYVKVGTYATDAETPVAQTAETTFTLITAKITG